MPGLVGPDSFPIRDVKMRPQKVGRIHNPKGYPDMGGLNAPGKWPSADNPFGVERATSVRAAHSTTRRNDD